MSGCQFLSDGVFVALACPSWATNWLIEKPRGRSLAGRSGTRLAVLTRMILKALGSYAIAKVLGFGIVGAIVIYALISMTGH